MTPCEKKGWKVGDRFIVPDDDTSRFTPGSEVELFMDDGSSCPLFKLISGGGGFPFAGGFCGHIHLVHIQPVGQMMTDNRTELKRQLAETREQMERLEAELEQTEQWEPEGGQWAITDRSDSDIFCFNITGQSPDDVRLGGRAYPTREQAIRARDLMRVHNRALAYVQEHAPDWDGYEPYEPWSVCWCKLTKKWKAIFDETESPGTVFGPRRVMEQLAADLNSGRVKL